MKFPVPPRGLTEVQSFKSAYAIFGLFPGTALTLPWNYPTVKVWAYVPVKRSFALVELKIMAVIRNAILSLFINR